MNKLEVIKMVAKQVTKKAVENKPILKSFVSDIMEGERERTKELSLRWKVISKSMFNNKKILQQYIGNRWVEVPTVQ